MGKNESWMKMKISSNIVRIKENWKSIRIGTWNIKSTKGKEETLDDRTHNRTPRNNWKV